MKNKISPQDNLEAINLIEQASEIMSDCINCGLCKSMCPIFRVLREEIISARGQAVLIRNKILTKRVFESALVAGVEKICPKKIKISQAILKARQAAVLTGLGLKENEKMIENLRKYGSPYGKKGEEDISKAYS
jgi:Fe-S oxidoreductase